MRLVWAISLVVTLFCLAGCAISRSEGQKPAERDSVRPTRDFCVTKAAQLMVMPVDSPGEAGLLELSPGTRISVWTVQVPSDAEGEDEESKGLLTFRTGGK